MNDIWVCSTCHSINRLRVSRCYRCGAGQAQAAPGLVADVRVETAVASRRARGYRPTWPFAVIASVLILVVAAMGLWEVLSSAATVAILKAEVLSALQGQSFRSDPALVAETSRLATPELVRFGVLVAAVLMFGIWLSRVVLNIPALGGGVSPTSPTKALIYPLIPIVNLVKVPGMIQDALYRLDPKAGGFYIVVLAWFGLVGSWFVSLLGGWTINALLLRDLAAATSIGEAIPMFGTALDRAYALEIATACMVAAGAVFLVIVMARIEGRSQARDREIRVAVPG